MKNFRTKSISYFDAKFGLTTRCSRATTVDLLTFIGRRRPAELRRWASYNGPITEIDMATRKSTRSNVTDEVPPTVDPTTGIQLLKRLIEKAEAIMNKADLASSDHTAWQNLARDYLVRVFGSHSPNVSDVIHTTGDKGQYIGMSDYDYQEYLRTGFKSKIKILNTCIEQLETDIELATPKNKDVLIAIPEVLLDSRKVFVVHGHNQGIKDSVARFLEKLDLEPVILHEKPNAGRTVIEKISDYADVHFAIVLLTADDEGRVRNENAEMQLRARQNVIMELGYFLGKLGRTRVCALYELGVEIPSDYQGVLFVEIDRNDRWRNELVRELLAAGINVDANRIFTAE